MSAHKVLQRFEAMAQVLAKVRPDLSGVVLCPLCLGKFERQAIDDKRLSVEHIIPSKLGGNATTLTCTECNNAHGTKMDRHLVSGMKAIDALEGREPISMVWHNDKGHVAGNLTWCPNGEAVTIQIVGKASNPAGIEAIPSQLFDGATVKMTFNFDFVAGQYWRAAMRAAYLSLFDMYGYAYVLSDGAAQVRNVLNGTAPIQERVVMEAFPYSEPPGDMLIMPAALGGLGEFFVVLLRLRSKRTSYLAVLLPGHAGCDWNVLSQINTNPARLRLQTTPQNWTSELFIGLDEDPVTRLRRTRIPAHSPSH